MDISLSSIFECHTSRKTKDFNAFVIVLKILQLDLSAINNLKTRPFLNIHIWTLVLYPVFLTIWVWKSINLYPKLVFFLKWSIVLEIIQKTWIYTRFFQRTSTLSGINWNFISYSHLFTFNNFVQSYLLCYTSKTE